MLNVLFLYPPYKRGEKQCGKFHIIYRKKQVKEKIFLFKITIIFYFLTLPHIKNDLL